MKRKTLIHGSIVVSTMAFMTLGTLLGVSYFNNKLKETKAYSAASLPTTIDLNAPSTSTIRNYYSSLNSLSTSERQGENLLKNLKTILKNNQRYYSYENGTNIWRMYEITDRDWDKSPASSTTYGTYDSSTNKITGYTYGSSASDSKNNPYIHALYVNRNVDNQTTAWDDHNQDQWGINREHVWAKAEGFDSTGAGGARGDPFHLMAGNGYANNIHSNYFYGYVNTSQTYTNCGSTYSNLSGNLRGSSKTLGGSTNVFEPQDCDKGDIARSVFYMVARYNYISGSDSDGIDADNPNLALVQSLSEWSQTGYTSSTTRKGYMGIISDLLAWNRLDPPDEYEIQRNNLLYTNFTKNRNPFIDYPEWAEYIWGSASYNGNVMQSYNSNPTGYATPSSNNLNTFSGTSTETTLSLDKSSASIAVNQSTTISATTTGGSGSVSWTTSNSSVAQLSASTGFSVSVTGKASGTATITASYSGKTATCTVTVSGVAPTVTSVTVSPSSFTLDLSGTATKQLSATVNGTNNPSQGVTWSSSNTAVATVSNNGLVTAVAKGSATITATSTYDTTKSGQCAIAVVKTGSTVLSDTTYELVTTSAQMDLDRKFAIVATNYNYAMSTTQNTNNRGQVAITKDTNANTVTINSSVATFTLSETDTTDGVTHYAFYDSVNEGYLYAASSTKNYLKTESEIDTDGNASFYIGLNATTGVATIQAQGTNGRNTIRYNSTDSVFSCYAGSSTQPTVSLYQQKEMSGGGNISATGVSLNKTSTSIAKGSSETLTATVSPSEATNKNVTWSSSVPSVATVSSSGVVTAVSAGTTVITVTTEDGGFTATCTVTVTNASTGSTYYEKQTSVSNILDGQYVICANVSGTYYPMPLATTGTNQIASSTAITVSENRITEANATNYIVNLVVSGTTVNIKNSSTTYIGSNASKQIVSNATTAFDWTLEAGANGSFRLGYTSSDSKLRCLAYRASYTRFADYAQSNVTSGSTDYFDIELFKYTQGSGGYTVDNFVEDFLTGIVCDSTGATAPTFASGYSWSVLKTKYNLLTAAEQNELKNYTANANGNDEAKCVAKYDYIVSKYGTANYENFMSRTIASQSNNLGRRIVSNDAMLLLVVMSVLGTMTFAGWFIHKKKQYDL